MPATDIRKKYTKSRVHRGSQVVFGERAHLQEVLKSVQQAKLPAAQKKSEVSLLRRLVQLRTRELNRINPGWDRKFQKARNAKTPPRELLRLGELPPEDYLLARVLAEHPEAPPELLARLAGHPYAAVRENVARHPHTPPAVLEAMAEDAHEPLWFLVACNPSTPAPLRARLRARLRAS
jgi:hypothetical protein